MTKNSIIGGLVGGLAHAILSVVLWNHWFDNLGKMLTVKPLNAAYILIGMFMLGFVPVIFYIGAKIISPAIVTAIILFISGTSSLVAGSVTAPTAAPTPFALYVLFWVVVVTLAGMTGKLEHRRKKRGPG